MLGNTYSIQGKKSLTLGAIILSTTLASFSPIYAQKSLQEQHQEAVNAANPDKQLDPSDVIFQALMKIRAGEEAIAKEDFKTAWRSYSSALNYYHNLQLTNALWKPKVVNYRIKDLTKRLDELKPQLKIQLQKEQVAAEGIISGKEAFDPDKEFSIPSELVSITEKIKNLESDLVASKKRYERERTAQEASLLGANNQLLIFKKDNQSNPELIAKLEQEIERHEALLKNSKHYENAEREKITDQISKLRKDVSKYSSVPLKDDLEKTNIELGKRTEELRIVSQELIKYKEEAETYQTKLQNMATELASAKAENTRINDDLKSQAETGSKVVKGLMKQLEDSKKREATLTKDLKQTKVILAELTEKLDQQSAENKVLRQQLEDVSQERDRLSEIILKSPDDRIKKMAKQNLELMQELRDSRDTVARVSKNQGDNVERMKIAERDLAVAKQRILDFQEQNRKDTQRILTLQKQIASIKTGADNALNQGNLSPVEREENTILRATAKKYQRREAFIRKKWDLVKRHILTNNNDPEAVALVQNALTEEQLEITPREQEILNKVKMADGTFSRGSGVSREKAASTLAQSEQEVKTIHRVVAGLIQRNRLDSAKDLLEDANEIIPNKFSTLMNLGTVCMRMRNLDLAEQHFKDAIVMKRNNPFVHYMLGLNQYRKGDFEMAEKSLKFSHDLDATQEKVSYYLGAIAGNGGRFDQAEDHFKKAIRINPDMREAYMALSVNCLIKEQIEEAQDYYQEALEKGMTPVPAHAIKLGLPH